MTAGPGDPIRSELFFGAVYGLGLSSVIWAVVLFPPAPGAGMLVVVAMALCAGVTRPRLPFLGRFSPLMPVALAALVLAGLAAGVVTATLAELTAGLYTGALEGRRLRHAAFRAVAAAMAAFVAGLAYFAAGGAAAAAPGPGLLVPALAHGVAFLALYRTLMSLAASHSEGFDATRSDLPGRWRFALAVAASPALALPLLLVAGDPGLRRIALLAAALGLVYRLGTTRGGRRAGATAGPDRSLALRGAISRTLVKAIAGSDRAAQGQLWRVQGLCLAVGERLELDNDSLDALGTAALVRDIGKIGVPEPILDKPGALTAHEMDSVRLHPGFGAEMLAAIALPERVCEIVRHHHERWDGRGYPDGRRGTRIPVGARILAAVDNFDALTSPRPFRRAVSAVEARKHLRGEAGKMFDPEVIDVLLRLIDEQGAHAPRLVDPAHEADDAPVEFDPLPPVPLPPAQLQLRTLYDLERVTAYPIDLGDCLRLAAERIAMLVPHRSLAVYLLDEAGLRLRVAHAAGQGADALREVSVATGERLSGWAVRHRRAIVGREHSQPLERDGARSDLEHWLDDPRLAGLSSTLAAPLVAGGQCLGALTLYDGPGRDFTGEERRRLLDAAGHVGRAVLRARRAPPSLGDGMTDRLTGLPDGRFLIQDAAERLETSRDAGVELGLLAFQVSRTTELAGERFGAETAENGLCQIAGRLARHCLEHETLARFGPDTFVVLSPPRPGGALLERWNGFVRAVEERPLEFPARSSIRARMVSAHAAFPADGDDLADVLSTLQNRLAVAADQGATLVPFRSTQRSAG